MFSGLHESIPKQNPHDGFLFIVGDDIVRQARFILACCDCMVAVNPEMTSALW